MNLKNSKFYKRIQELRHFSKEKMRKDQDRSRTKRKINMALSERMNPHRSDVSEYTTSSPSRTPKYSSTKQGQQQQRLQGQQHQQHHHQKQQQQQQHETPPRTQTNRRFSTSLQQQHQEHQPQCQQRPSKFKTRLINNLNNHKPRINAGKDIAAFKDKSMRVDAGDHASFASMKTLPVDECDERKLNGMIQLNNVCFRVSCPMRISGLNMRDDIPSITDAKSSICVTNSRYTMIGKISKALGFKLVKETKLWNILWSDSFPGVELFKNMKRFQQINHFPGMIEICRKDLLSRNLNRMLKLYPHDYKIFPKTWMLPADYGDALNYAINHKRTFILKPDSGAQGRGIWLTNDLKTIGPNERLICQTYISKPLLIDGYKFDLRVYTLITSVDPLRIFVYNEGLARFATNKYVEPTSANSNDLYMHLTNYSVNKRNSQYDLCDNDDCGSKRKLSAINNWMRRHNYDVDEFWANVDDVIIKTVLSAWPVLKHNYHACFPGHDKIQACFEVLGFDILVDWKLKPYILEVNHSPSFHTNEQVDREVKRPLIRDTLSLVSTVLADKKQIMREDRKRVKQRLLKAPQKGDNTQRSYTARVSTASNKSSLKPTKSTDEESEPGHQIGSLAQQIAWEESHLGNFRRIMPPTDPSKVNYYCKFYAQTNQVSIFAETAASKKREDLAKKMRLQIEERKAVQRELQNGRVRREEKLRKKRTILPRNVREKQRLQMYRLQENWTPGFVSEAEERLRRTWLQMRTEAMRSLKVTENIYSYLYFSGVLSNTDINTFPQLYNMLKNGDDIVGDS